MSAIGPLQEVATGDLPLNWDAFVTPGIPVMLGE